MYAIRSYYALTLMERVQELVMLRLRTTRGLRVKAYRELTGSEAGCSGRPEAALNYLVRNNFV